MSWSRSPLSGRRSEAMTSEKKTFQKSRKPGEVFRYREKYGGTLKSSQVAEHIGKSKVLGKNMKDAGKLLALMMGGDFVYPIFRFSNDEALTDETGPLLGLVDLLKLLQNNDDVMQFGFFVS